MIFPNLQSGLFKYTFDEGGCSLFQAILLFLEGLLSFDPQKKIEYEGYEIKELVFLKSLYFESNISANTIKAMLKKLNKPYSYSFKEIY